jgi:hypothetical protein
MYELTESKLLDQLIVKRAQLIKTYCDAVKLQQAALRLADEMNNLIPDTHRGYIDDFSTVFIHIAGQLGEHTNRRALPRECNIARMSESDLIHVVTKSVDAQLWSVLFNRLGIFTLMSAEIKAKYRQQFNENPAPFDIEHVHGTMAQIHQNQGAMLIESMLDFVTGQSKHYASNSTRAFTKKIIIENAFSQSMFGDQLNLQTHEKLQTLLTLISRWVYRQRMSVKSNGVQFSEIWDALINKLQEIGLDWDQLRCLQIDGLEFRFFKKGTVHVLISDEMLYHLNKKLSETNTLPR